MLLKIGIKNIVLASFIMSVWGIALFFVNYDFLDKEKFVVVPAKVVSIDETQSIRYPNFKIQYTYNGVLYTKDIEYYQIVKSYSGNKLYFPKFPVLNENILFSIHKNNPDVPNEMYEGPTWGKNIVILFGGGISFLLMFQNIKDRLRYLKKLEELKKIGQRIEGTIIDPRDPRVDVWLAQQAQYVKLNAEKIFLASWLDGKHREKRSRFMGGPLFLIDDKNMMYKSDHVSLSREQYKNLIGKQIHIYKNQMNPLEYIVDIDAII